MLQTELSALLVEKSRPRVLGANDLSSARPRTLIWGYTCERNSFHVYLDSDRVIKGVVYAHPDKLLRSFTQDSVGDNEGYLPNKRIYPEACDYEFCRLLVHAGVQLNPTSYNEQRDLSKTFHGLRLEELKQE